MNFIINCVLAQEYYNILTIDGGGAKGLITAVVIDHIELYAYEYAKNQSYQIKTYVDNNGAQMTNRIHMSQIFDMIAGTSIGSVTASALSYPNPVNKTDPYFYAP